MMTPRMRAGVFDNTDQAVALVKRLHEVGFTWNEISVVCSDENREKMFPKEVRNDGASAANANEAMNIAGAGVLGLGGLAAVAALASTAGTAIVIMGAFAGIAAAGTFASLMATRGFENSATDYYEQAVQEGKILVAVEVDDDNEQTRQELDRAEQLIREAGAEPLPLAGS